MSKLLVRLAKNRHLVKEIEGGNKKLFARGAEVIPGCMDNASGTGRRHHQSTSATLFLRSSNQIDQEGHLVGGSTAEVQSVQS